jgi:hypothetical protein
VNRPNGLALAPLLPAFGMAWALEKLATTEKAGFFIKL